MSKIPGFLLPLQPIELAPIILDPIELDPLTEDASEIRINSEDLEGAPSKEDLLKIQRNFLKGLNE